MYQRILVPLDGSARAEAILPHVREMALRYDATVLLLQVIEPVYEPSMAHSGIPSYNTPNRP